MELVLHIIGFIVAFYISRIIVVNILFTASKRIPFVRKLQRLGALKGFGIYANYVLLVLVSMAVILTIILIPSYGVVVGAIIGLLLSIRDIFKISHDNAIYVDFVRSLQNRRAIVNEREWAIFVQVVEGIDKFERVIASRDKTDIDDVASKYTLNAKDRATYKDLNEEFYEQCNDIIQALTNIREELLENDASLWEGIVLKNTQTSEIDSLKLKMADIKARQQALLSR